jgi:predicted nucleotidyltransferase
MVTAAANKQETIDRITAVREPLLTHGVRRLALFGSFSRNQQHANSDVDLLVEFASGCKSYVTVHGLRENCDSTTVNAQHIVH